MRNHRAARAIVALLVLQSLFYFSIARASSAENAVPVEPPQAASKTWYGEIFGASPNLFSFAQSNAALPNEPPQTLWAEMDKNVSENKETDARRQIFPNEYRLLRLDETALSERLNAAPRETETGVKNSPSEIVLPLPIGGYGRFRIVESPIMEDALAAQFPEIRTFLGQGIDDPTATVRFDRTAAGFHAQILSASGAAYIDPYLKGDTSLYIAYDKRDLPRGDKRFSCLFKTAEKTLEQIQTRESPADLSFGETRRSYRLAVAATGEYTQFTGGTTQSAMAAIATTMNRVNGLYQRYFAVRMILVGGNASLIYADANTDPYTNNNGDTMLAENQITVDSVIGTANYDIGHVFSTGGGGIASFQSPCNPSTKAQGVTGSSSPVGDPFDVDYVAHEIGHQFGGDHTFDALHPNNSGSSCTVSTRVPATAFEPGSGSTILAYAGICPPGDLQPNSDSYFHNVSLMQMSAFMNNSPGGNACAVGDATGNGVPTVSGGGDYTIPPNTPFTLTATGSDSDGDALTYTWEQSNASPLFRSRPPSENASRTFPSMQYILNNANTPPTNYACTIRSNPTNCLVGERLPGTNGTITFKATVYDNRTVGAFADDTVVINVAGSPFSVAAPNAAPSNWREGALQSVAWNVGGGSVANRVKISLSIDGGQTFPTILAANTANDGEETIVVPEVGDADVNLARVKIEAVGNIFFDVSDQNFDIANHPNFAVGGRVVNQNGGAEGITLTLSGGGGYVRTATADANGNYVFNYVPANVNYTVTPSNEETIFSPAGQATGNLTANTVLPNFSSRRSRTFLWTQLTQVIAIPQSNPGNIQRNNHWDNFYNWQPNGIPGPDDRIIVNDSPRIYQPPGGLDPITYTPQGLSLNGVAFTVNGFSLDGNSLTGGVLTLGGDIPGSSQFKRGLLDVVMNVSAGASFDWNGGTFHSAATVAENGFFIISGDSERAINRSITIDNAGEMRWYDSGTIKMNSPAYSEPHRILTINNAGTFRAEGDGKFRADYQAEVRVNNFGTFVKTSASPTGTTAFYNSAYPIPCNCASGLSTFTNYGTLNVQSGILDFGGGGRLTVKNGSTIQGGGLALVDNGELILPFEDNPTSVLDGVLEFRSGRVDGKGAFNGSGVFNWTGGTVGIIYPPYVATEDVQLAFGASVTTNISGDADKHLGAYGSGCNPCQRQSGRLTFNGTTNWTGAGAIYSDYSGGSGIVNNGTFNIRNDSQIHGDYYALSFTNNGTVKKEIATGTTTFGGSLNFINAGTLDSGVGVFEITGNADLNAGSAFDGGTSRFKGYTRLRGAVYVGTAANAATLELAGGRFEASIDENGAPLGSISSGNPAAKFDWTNGETIGILNLNAGLTTNLTGAGNQSIGVFNFNYNNTPTGTINNHGTFNWHGGVPLRFAHYGGVLNNSGTLNLLGDDVTAANDVPGTINNTGTIAKTNSTGTSIIQGVNVNNFAVVNAESGAIEFRRDLNLESGAIFKGAGTSRAKGYTRIRSAATVGDSNAPGKFEFAGGILEGTTDGAGAPIGSLNSGNAGSRFVWTGGELIGIAKLNAGLTTEITGSGNKDLGRAYFNYNNTPTGRIDNAGTINWREGDIRFAFYGGVLNNSGTFNLHGNNSAYGSDATGAFNNTGTLNKINTDGATTIGTRVNLNSTGAINLSLNSAANTNRLIVNQTATFGGTLNVKFINGFNPTNSDTMPIVGYGSRGGSFANVATENLNGGRSLQTRYNPNNLTVRAFAPIVPVPNTPTPENWLKADALAGANNSLVPTWADASGKSNNATQTDQARQPKLVTNAMNGKPVLRFDGANDQMRFDRTIDDDFTITAVFQSKRGIGNSTNWWASAGIIDGEVSGVVNDFGLALNVDGRIIGGVGNPDTMAFTAPIFNDGKPHIVTFTRQRANGEIKVYVDGVLRDTKTGSSATLTSPPRLVIGSRQDDANYLAGDIAEVITYGSLLSEVDRASIDNYLSAKYISTAPQTAWNAAADFQPNQNAATAWSYGYLQSGAFSLYTSREFNEAGAGIDRWGQDSLGTGREPSVRGNLTGTMVDYYGSVRQAADELSVHPNNNRPSVVRWTAPEAGTYLIQGRFDGNDYSRGTTSDVKLNHNADTLLAAPINGFGATLPFSRIVAANAGDTIDFVVGTGTNNNPDNDITGLAATITKAPTSISGRVTDNTAGVANITVTLKQNGATISAAATDSNGNYAFAGNLTAGANYIVEAAHEDYSFAPASITINNLSGHQTADFAATQIGFEASRDFTNQANPSGAWSYGWSAANSATFNLFPNKTIDTLPGIDRWYQASLGGEPVVLHNKTGGQYNTGGVRLPAGMLWVHPGGGNQKPVIRWTAPATGMYRVNGRFEGVEIGGGGTTTDGAVLRNGQTMASGYVHGFGAQLPFDLSLTVNAGDTIDFRTGFGTNGWNGYDSTGVAAAIRPISVSSTINSIAGTLTGSDGATPVSGAVVSLYKDGVLSSGAITNAAGQFNFPNLETNGNYIVSAAKTGIVFKPASRSFLKIAGAKTADFTTGIFTAPNAQCAVPPANVVSWYRAADNADDRASGNNGTIEPGVIFVDGKAGRAFDFNGTGGVALGNPLNLKITSKMTIAAWVKPRPMSDGQYAAVVGKWNNVRAGDSYMLYLYKRGGGNIEVASAIGRPEDDESGLNGNLISTGAEIKPNEWAHVAMIYDQADGTNIVYVNGIEVGRRAKLNGINNSDTPVYIGRRNSSGSTIPFNGAIDEAAIFNRVLTPSEIRSAMDADTAGKCGEASANTPQGASVNAGTFYGAVNFASVTTAGMTTFAAIDPAQNQPPAPNGYSFSTALPAFDITTTAVYDEALTQCLTVSSVSDAIAFSRLRVLHVENGAWIDRTLSKDFPTRTICGQTNHLSPFAVADFLAPTAATVSISGRVTAGRGKGIRNARLTLTEADGATRTTLTDNFGRYRFANLAAGQTVIVSVQTRRAQLSPTSQILNLTENLTDVNFTIQDGGLSSL